MMRACLTLPNHTRLTMLPVAPPQPATAKAFSAELRDAMLRGYVAAYRWLGREDQARDACQEAALKALRAARRYDRSKPFYPWFYRILKNHCRDRLRRRKTAAVALQHEPADHTPNAERRALRVEQDVAVRRAIASLPGELREVIELRHFQDVSYQQMASILSIPVGTVMSRLYRARKTLRGKLKAGDAKRYRPAADEVRS